MNEKETKIAKFEVGNPPVYGSEGEAMIKGLKFIKNVYYLSNTSF